MQKINQIKKNIKVLKNVTIVITFLSISFSSYITIKKYKELKDDFQDKLTFNEVVKISDEYNSSKEEIREKIYNKHINESVDEKTLIDYVRVNVPSNLHACFAIIEAGGHDSFSPKELIAKYRSNYIHDINNKRIKAEQWNEIKGFENFFDIEERIAQAEVESKLKTANVNFIFQFPISYIIGVILGTIFFPCICWLLWYIEKLKINKIIEKDRNKKIEVINSHPQYGIEYNKKKESLDELNKMQILKIDEFNKKLDVLINEYFVIIENEMEIQKTEEIKIKLLEAYELGSISKDELNEKLNFYGIYNLIVN